jgi:MFS family permease
MSEEKTYTIRSKGYVRYIVIFMGLVGLLDNSLNLMENIAIPGILEEFSIDPEFFAFWQGIFGVVTFAVFFIAWFSDAFGRKKGVLVLMLVMGIPALLIPFLAINLLMFYILYSIVITGTLSNLWEIPVTEEAPAEKRGTLGGIATLISLIPIYAILGPRIADSLGWRWTYGIFFFMMIGLLLLWYFMKEPQRWLDAKDEKKHEIRRIKQALKSLNRTDAIYIIISTIVYGLWSISFKLGSAWGGHYYINVRSMADEWNTIILIAGLFILIGALTSGILMDKVSRKATLIIGCIGSVLAFILLGITGSQIFFWMAYFFMPIVFTWIMVYFAEVYRTEIRTTATGIAATGARTSYIIGPLLASALLSAFPTMEWFWIIAGLFMIVPLISLVLKPYETKGKTLEEIQKER